MRFTLNQIKKTLETFAASHAQVNEMLFKDPLELLNDKETMFPVTIAVLRPGRFAGTNGNAKTVSFIFDFYLMDLVAKDLSNEYEVLSDQIQIAADLLAYLDKPEFNDSFTIETSGSYTPFYEKGDNEMTGVQIGIEFKVIDLGAHCEIPS